MWRHGRGVFIASLADARARFPEAAPLLEQAGTETAVVLPIMTEDRVRALITLAWRKSREFPDDRDFMELFAAQCGEASVARSRSRPSVWRGSERNACSA